MNGLPSSLERDTLYWLGAGSYGGYTFDDGAVGQESIVLRKATAQEHGTDAGWSATYGNGQAVFGPLKFSASRYTIDGGEPNGIRTVGKMGTKATVDVVASHIVLRHIEIDGGVQKNDGTQTAGGCNGSNVNGDYVVFDRCEIHNIADDGLGLYADHIKVLHSKIHNLHGCGTDSHCSGPCFNGHSDGLELSGASDVELAGNMVYDVDSTAALFLGSGGASDLVVYNNVFYTPTNGMTVYLKELTGAKVHNNIIWGRTQGDRYGGLSIGNNVTDLEMNNNIILNINYSHMSASHDPSQHRLDYNLFGMINSSEYPANSHDLVGDPKFAGILMSSDAGDHKGSELTLEDFMSTAAQVIDTGTVPGGVPAYDILGRERPKGGAWDRGPFEALP
ncbi:right-handed parallel beta-helix repeat-containing protein [Deltaproteobacteria bacterium]|nr:right-handed parallel beta-helix repeat-containing protein [Deltaproteobacteria bacterium]